MIPTPEFMKLSGELWKILKSGRLWKIIIESWKLHDYYLDVVPGMPKLFYKLGSDNKPCLVIAKVVDDLLLRGTPEELNIF